MRGEIAKKNLALVISNLSHPVLLVVFSIIFLVNRYADSLDESLRGIGIGLLLLVISPGILYLIASKARREQVDFDVSNRADRPLPLLVASLGALIGGYLVADKIENSNLLLISNVLVAMLLSLTMISLVWKISVHTSTLMALVTLLVIFRGEELAWLYLLILPVGWARVYLKQHTVMQVVAGSAMGVITTAAAAIIFRN